MYSGFYQLYIPVVNKNVDQFYLVKSILLTYFYENNKIPVKSWVYWLFKSYFLLIFMYKVLFWLTFRLCKIEMHDVCVSWFFLLNSFITCYFKMSHNKEFLSCKIFSRTFWIIAATSKLFSANAVWLWRLHA